VELVWTEDGHVEMQGEASNGSKTQWPPHYEPQWNNGQVVEDGVTLSRPSASSANKDGAVVAVVSETAAETPVAPNIDYHDDEMVSWLQYPLDDSLERNYCSEFFGELPNSNMQVVKESLVGQGAGRLPRMPVSNTGTDTVVNKASSAEAAMALGAGRAAGVIPQTGAEAFSKVRTLQPSFSKWQTHSPIPTSSKGFGAYPTASQALPRTSPPASRPLLAPMAPPKPQPRAGTHIMQADSARKLAPVNFSHFSTSAAILRNYQGVGVLSGTPSNTLCKQPLAKLDVDASTSTGSSISESTTKGRSGIGSQKDIEIHLQGSDSQQQSPGVDAGETVPIPATRKEVEMPLLEGDSVICDTKPTEQDTLRTSVVTDSAVLESADKGMPQGRKVPDSQEPTVTSSSGGSGNSAERAKEASTSNKRKAKLTEETDCQSEVSTLTLVYRDTCSPSNLLVVGESFGKRFRKGTAESTIVEGLAFRRQAPSLCFNWHQILEFNFTHALQSWKCLCTMLPTSLYV
jgi:phytochrome-interacting factor 3